MVDAVKFKVINDTFGHEAGDTFLRRIGTILTDNVGSVSVYRRGGDEFILIVNDITSADKMDAIGERLTRYFNQAQDAEGKIIPSVSIGGFFLGENASDIEREVCLQAADQALAVIKTIRAAEPDRKNLEGYWIGQNKVSCEIPLSGYLPFVPEVAVPEIVPGVSAFGTLESLRQLGAPRIETNDSDDS
jgi:diguanylate cyclase (GGDEF)-like protein